MHDVWLWKWSATDNGQLRTVKNMNGQLRISLMNLFFLPALNCKNEEAVTSYTPAHAVQTTRSQIVHICYLSHTT